MISVFKTSVTITKAIEKFNPHLDIQLEFAKWNFDLEDCDNNLRIVSVNEIAQPTIKILKDNGFD